MTDALTYVYCLVRRARRPVLADVPSGVPGSTHIRALDAGGGLWAVVCHVPRVDYDETALTSGLQNLDWVGRRAMAHEAVVEHFLDATALLPMQLFALFTSDDRVLDHIARARARIDAILARIERQVEWGLRLSFDEKSARQVVEEQYGGRRTTGRSGSADSGATYLERKRDLLDVTRVQLTEAKAEADRLYRAMAREATDARRRTATEQAAPGSRLLLDAAFLVPARRAGAFRSALRQNARKLNAAGIVVSLTGPWPPYNFIDSTSAKAPVNETADKTVHKSARKGTDKPRAARRQVKRTATKGAATRGTSRKGR